MHSNAELLALEHKGKTTRDIIVIITAFCLFVRSDLVYLIIKLTTPSLYQYQYLLIHYSVWDSSATAINADSVTSWSTFGRGADSPRASPRITAADVTPITAAPVTVGDADSAAAAIQEEESGETYAGIRRPSAKRPIASKVWRDM